MTATHIAPWWQDGAIYHIYPRSFLDTDGDGFGDLPGITARLPYIRRLGVDAIWMGPIFSSPQIDNGYDISDYLTVDPLFGTNDDLYRLIEEAHRLDIRVLLDLVFNHTSDRHRWFESSRRRKDGCDDFYIWRDGDPSRPDGLPNDWRGFFSLPAWSYDAERGQYYLHLFAREQPDLNWDNPAVRAALREVANFWIDRGVDGFRMDVINLISKQPSLPSLNGASPSGIYLDGPRVLEYLQEFRSGLHDRKGIVLVGETPGITPDAASRYTLPENRALDMVLLFDHVMVDHGPEGRWDPTALNPRDLAATCTRWQRAIAPPRHPSLYMSNHDQPRVVSRYGDDGTFRYESAVALAMYFYLQRGTPIVYQGDEIAMANFPFSRVEEIVDIESSNAYRWLTDERGVDAGSAQRRVFRQARDNGRTPMQWDDSRHAGFTAGDSPWFPVNPDYTEWNVKCQKDGRSSSVLDAYRRLLSVRKSTPVLHGGSYEALEFDAPPTVVGFRRVLGEDEAIIVVNLGSGDAAVRIDRADCDARVLLSNYPDPPSLDDLHLRAWEGAVYLLSGDHRTGSANSP